MDLLRTPEARFAAVHGYDHPVERVDVGGVEMAYASRGEGAPILCLHGEPTWGYVYRKMVPGLARVGRVILPDHIGFGRSDKPVHDADHTFANHLTWVGAFVEALDLSDVTLVCQDWGGLLGLPTAVDHWDRFARLVITNTGLPDGSVPMPDEWLRFAAYVERTPDVPIEFIIDRATVNGLTREAKAAYQAPFPDATYKGGPRALPRLIPKSPDAPGADIMRDTQKRLGEWDKPALVTYGLLDPITSPAAEPMARLIPTAERVEWVEGAGHFIQEDAGPELAARIAAWVTT